MFYHLIYPLHVYVSGFNVFRYITVRAAFAAITAFIISMLIGKYVIAWLKSLSVTQVIREEGPKEHLLKKGTPTMGGIIILAAFFGAMLLWCRFDNNYVYIVFFAALWFGAIGFVDDFMKLKVGTKGLAAKWKFLLQLAGGLIVAFMYAGFSDPAFKYATLLNVPFVKNPVAVPLWAYIIFIMVLIAGWSNAVNFTDGMDGLASGLLLFIFGTFVVLSYIIGNFRMSEYLFIMHIPKASEITVICAAMTGAILGFLWFNTYPAEVFMGDVGALMLGGVVGTVAVLIKQELLLLIVGIIFVAEVASVMIQVTGYKLTKMRVFKMAPLHHHFQLKGVPEPKLIIRFWIVAVIVLLFTLSTLKLR
ncbi:MAG: phospho-N-acetylmuramoyl-pentapeptide-transferase [Spirochaetia bacterium]|nr:phospho-N-acetylmuramoyl-pentapeptide-transferase [Spirochaetia bacterium]